MGTNQSVIVSFLPSKGGTHVKEPVALQRILELTRVVQSALGRRKRSPTGLHLSLVGRGRDLGAPHRGLRSLDPFGPRPELE